MKPRRPPPPRKLDRLITCFVPTCKRKVILNPKKHFFYVPRSARSQWCAAANKPYVPKGSFYICEDHLNLKEDLLNYREWMNRKTNLPRLNPQAPKKLRYIDGPKTLEKDNKAKKKWNTIKRQKKYEIVIEPSIPEPNETSATSLHNQSPSHSDIPDAEPEVILPDSWLMSEPVSAENDILTGQLSVEDTTIKLETEESDEILTGTDELRKDTAEDQYVPVKHEGISCDCCKGDIIGFRYTCVQCEQYNLCSACESKLTHAHHYVLRVAVPKPQCEIKDVIAAIRFKIEMLEDALTQNSTILNDCVEIKKEDPLLFEVEPNVDMQDTSDMNSNKKTSTDDTLTLNTTEKDSSNIFGNITTVCSNIFENNKAERYNSNIDEVSKDMNTDENWWQETQSERIHEKEDTADVICQNTAKRKNVTKVDDEVRVFCY